MPHISASDPRQVGKLPAFAYHMYKKYRSKYADGFVFIHINKTGGSSVEKALRLPFVHKTARQYIDEYGPERWAQKHRFTVVRNPWDKVVSQYHYRVKTDQDHILTDGLSFSDWVVEVFEKENPRYINRSKFFDDQVSWLVDYDGRIDMDTIIRFETLDADFRALCDTLGLRAELPHLKTSERDHYGGYYDDATRSIVAERFARDIEAFGYAFAPTP